MKQQHAMTIHHDKPVGVDCFFREIFPGDTVRDADGKEYTIDERGWARPMDGSTGCGFKKLKEPSFVSHNDKPDTRFQEDASGKVSPAPMVEASGPEGDVPTKEEIAALPSKEEISAEPAPEVRRTGGRANRSGVVQIEFLARKVGAKGIAGLAAYLRDHDIEVTYIPNRNKQTIRIEDRDRALELTKAWAAERQEMLDAMRGEPDVYMHDGCIDINLDRALREEGGVRVAMNGDDPHRPRLGTNDPAYTFSKFDAFLILEDKDLADELRRRGYEVTAVKHIEL